MSCPVESAPENVGRADPLLILQTQASDLIDRVAKLNCHQYGRADNKIEAEVHNFLDPNIVVGLTLFARKT